MNEIVNFVKEILMLETTDKTPIGLCGFDCIQEQTKRPVKQKRKKEMRLSELME